MEPARRWPIYVVCVLGVVVALLAYSAQWHRAEFPPDFAVDTLAYPVQLADYPARSPERFRFLAESWPPGTILSFTDAGGESHSVRLVLRQGRTALILTGIGGLVFLVAAICIFAPRTDRPGAGSFFWISLLYGLSIMVGGVFFPREHSVLLTVFGLIQIACLAALPAVFLRLALVFPRRAAVLDRHRWLVPLLAVGAAAVFAWQAVVLLRYFAAPTVVNGARLAPALTAADIFMVSLTLAGMVILAARGRRLELTRERNQVRWLLWGFAIGAAPYVALRTVPELLGLSPLMPDHVDRAIELAIPFAFTMAVVRHQFLDIDVIIRRSLLYGLLAAVLVGLYLAAATVFGRWLGVPEGVDPWFLPVVLGLGAGIAFLPLRRALGRWIDETFFKLTFDRDKVLDRLDLDLANVASRQSLADAVLRSVRGVLTPDRAAVIIERSGHPATSGDLPADLFGDDRAGSYGSNLVAAPRTTSKPEVESTDLPPRLLDAGFVLVQPLLAQDEPVGGILLGRHSNERRYVEPDLDFLADCARLAAQHLERIALLQAVAEESLARERLTELERLKSEFLAQVAHDLRTPVTGISWSARNLDDGLAGPLNGDQLAYVHSIAQSCEYLNRLVCNLLEISRLDRAEATLELADVSAAAVWQQAVSTIAPLAAAKNVELVIEGFERPELVRANADKLAEIAVNLLDNAVKYAAAGTAVSVTIHPPENGHQLVSVRDRGPGLCGQLPETLFARFAQGVASPNSTRKGFGLGLHIAVTYLGLMGGTLAAGDRPDGGADFSCRLRLAVSTSENPGERDVP